MRLIAVSVAAGMLAASASAQNVPRGGADGAAPEPLERSERRLAIAPYIEASQILTAQLSSGDDVLTFTQLAAGVDASVNGRRNAASLSLRYERNIGWGRARDSDALSGLARAATTLVPDRVTLEAGALASRTSIGSGGRSLAVPSIDRDTTSQTYAAYVGPSARARIDEVEVTGQYRLGYARVEAPTNLTTNGGATLFDATLFDESVTHTAQLRAEVAPDRYAPVGVGIEGGYFREDIDVFDQRVEDAYVRGDVTVPITPSVAVVGGVGYENVRVSSRDALRDETGAPVIGADGRVPTDENAPRVIAFEADGLIWDVGVLWRPSRRTRFAAGFGRRYDSDTYYGNFTWAPDRSTNVTINAYDGISGVGGRLNNSLAALPTDFEVIRDPVTGEILGCTSANGGGSCLDGLFGSVRSSVFRSRGVAANVSRRIGRYTASISGGYDRRRFIGAPGTILAATDGITDESLYLAAGVTGQLSRASRFTVTSFANWFDTELAEQGGSFVLGSSAAYFRDIGPNLTARAALSLTLLDSENLAEEIKTASALIGLRYGF